MSLSLDLSRAFDSVRRGLVYQALRENGVDQATIEVVQHLHYQARYHFSVGDHKGSTDVDRDKTGMQPSSDFPPI